MTVINFTVSKPLENKINKAIKKHGFASRAEFFRFLAMNFTSEEGAEEKFLSDPDTKIQTGKFSNTKDLFKHMDICRK